MTTVVVEAKVVGRREASAPSRDLQVGLTAGPVTLRALIEAVVRAEVAAFLERAADERLVRVLTAEALEAGLAAGVVRSGDREVAADVDPDEAVAVALLAHADGFFQAIVDERPVDDLDDVLVLRNGTQVMFLRLIPLAGG